MDRIFPAKHSFVSAQDRLTSPGSSSVVLSFASVSENSIIGGLGLSGETFCFLLSRLKP